jgi:hypothetical protein
MKTAQGKRPKKLAIKNFFGLMLLNPATKHIKSLGKIGKMKEKK